MAAQDLSENDINNFKSLLDLLKRFALDGVPSSIEKEMIQMLDQSLPFFSHLILTDSFPELHRLTINRNVIGSNKRIRNIDYLKYPPYEKVSKYGRCNLRQQSILYASVLPMTALKELKPKRGDMITQSVWRVKGNQTIKYCPIFKNQPLDGKTVNPRTLNIGNLYRHAIKDYPENLRLQIDALVQFIADAFTKEVNTDNDLDYIFSAYFANKMLYDFEEGTIEGIYYPSVKERLSFENVAVKPEVFDRKYELVNVKDSVVVVDPSYGTNTYGMEGLGECKSFDYVNGGIFWDMSKTNQTQERINEHKLNFGIDLEE